MLPKDGGENILFLLMLIPGFLFLPLPCLSMDLWLVCQKWYMCLLSQGFLFCLGFFRQLGAQVYFSRGKSGGGEAKETPYKYHEKTQQEQLFLPREQVWCGDLGSIQWFPNMGPLMFSDSSQCLLDRGWTQQTPFQTCSSKIICYYYNSQRSQPVQPVVKA